MNQRTVCESCGKDYGIGDSPFCRDRHEPSARVVIQDEIPGGQWFENGFDTPRKFYSHSAHRAALAEQGLEIRAKWAGPEDKHLTRWDTVNLEAAKALVSRGAEIAAARAERRRLEAVKQEFPITVTEYQA